MSESAAGLFTSSGRGRMDVTPYHASHQTHTPYTSHQTHMSHQLHPPDRESMVLKNTFSSENFSAMGLLTPALALVPELEGTDSFSKRFKDLQGEDKDIVLAAAHIDDARTGRGRYGKARYYFKQRHAQIAFKFITNKWFQRLIYAAVLLHSSLTFIEPPSVDPRSVTTYIALGLGLVSLLLYLLDIILNVMFLSWKVFWTFEERSWNRVEFVFLCCFTVDWLLLIAQIASGNKDIIQPFRCLRLGMIMCKAKNVGHITNVVKSIIIKLGGVVFIVLVFIILYSSIGVHLAMQPFVNINEVNISSFRPPEETVTTEQFSDNGVNETVVYIEVDTCSSSTENDTNIYEGTFNHIGTAMYQMFVLLTTENYPVIMFPAYIESQWYFVYFGTFLFFGVFFITSILLAIIADLYWQYNKKHVKKERAKQRVELVKAWKLLDILGQERLSVDDGKLLKLFKLLKPKNTDSENRGLIAELDPEGTGWVDWILWVTQLLSILDLETTTHHHGNKFQSGPRCLIIVSKIARKITAWVVFEKTVLFLIILHTILFALKWEGMSLTAEIIVQGLKSVIVAVFLFEITVRVAAEGKDLFNNFINTLDLILVILGFISNIFWYAVLSPTFEDKVDAFLWRGWSVVISCLSIFIRLFFNSSQSRRVMTVFFRLFPVMLDLIILFGIVLYFYGVLGMEVFHSFAITTNTPDADHLLYGCGLGFENFKCSLFIVFQILTTSNWHEIMNTVIVSLNSYAPVIYFIPCYIVINLVIMNLLVAIGIEAFNKFSQEQKDEDKEAEPNSQNSAHYNNEDASTCQGLVHFGKKLLTNVGSFAKAAFSSARVVDDGYHDDSVIHIEIQNHTPSDHMIVENRLSSGYSSSSSRISSHSSSLLFQSSSDSRSHSANDSVLINQSAGNIEDVEGADDVFLQSPYVPVSDRQESPKAGETRQEKMKRLLKERQKKIRMKKPVNVITASIELQSYADGSASADSNQTIPEESDERRESVESVIERSGSNRRSKKWGSAAQAISFIGQISSEVEKEESTDQFDTEDLKRSSLKGRHPPANNAPKFRRGYNHGNWRSEVQNITIINKEEIHELRRQLAAKPKFKARKGVRRHASVDSDDTADGYNVSRRSSLEKKRPPMMKDVAQSSVDSTLTLTQLDMQEKEEGRRQSISSITDSILSQRKLLSSVSVDTGDLTRNRRSSTLSDDLERPFEPSAIKDSRSGSLDSEYSMNQSRTSSISSEAETFSMPLAHRRRSSTLSNDRFGGANLRSSEQSRDSILSCDGDTESTTEKQCDPDNQDCIVNSQPRRRSILKNSPPFIDKQNDTAASSVPSVVLGRNSPSNDSNPNTPSQGKSLTSVGAARMEGSVVSQPRKSLTVSFSEGDTHTSGDQSGVTSLLEGTSEDQFDVNGELRKSRPFFKTPLISVEEVTEPVDQNSDYRPDSHRLKVPGAKRTPSGNSKREEKADNGGDQRVNKEMPDWVKKLTEKYNVSVHTDSDRHGDN